MDDLDAILADLQASAAPSPPGPPSPPSLGPSLGPRAQLTEPSYKPTPDHPPVPRPVVEESRPLSNKPALDNEGDYNLTDDYDQELQQLQHPSRTSNIEDLDSLLDDLNFTQKRHTPSVRSNVNSSYDNRGSSVNVNSMLEELSGGTEAKSSNATRDLDSLMESLTDFKVAHDTPTPKCQGYESLDGMLGTLDSDLAAKGVHLRKKGDCAMCNKMIVGQIVTALGRTWHPEHFVCEVCKVELGTGNFFERDQKPYCEQDYHALFSPRCALCNEPILDKCTTAMQKTWHPEHFVCVHCHSPFTGTEYHVFEGKPYCSKDYYEKFAPKCGACSEAIVNNCITALKKQWHVECFVCYECKNRFGAGTYYEHEGRPYCEIHYHQNRGSLCAACNKPITGRCITAMRNKFHPEHFVCAFCITQLSKGTFKEHQEKPYCHTCYSKLFGCSPRM